jgi:hypothetical protein
MTCKVPAWIVGTKVGDGTAMVGVWVMAGITILGMAELVGVGLCDGVMVWVGKNGRAVDGDWVTWQAVMNTITAAMILVAIVLLCFREVCMTC